MRIYHTGLSATLRKITDRKSSTSMMFAVHDDCTILDIKKPNEEKCKMAKGWKIPIAVIEFLNYFPYNKW
jgi:hypothetical protein